MNAPTTCARLHSLLGKKQAIVIPAGMLITTGSQIHQAAEQRFCRNRNSGSSISVAAKMPRPFGASRRLGRRRFPRMHHRYAFPRPQPAQVGIGNHRDLRGVGKVYTP